MQRRASTWLALCLGGCAVDPGSMADAFDSQGSVSASATAAGESSDGSGGVSSTSASSTASGESSEDSAIPDPSDPDSSSSDPSTTNPSTTDPSTTDPSTTDPTDPSGPMESTGPAEPVCGDGFVDPGEACDCSGQCSAAELDATDCTDLPSPAGPSFDGGALGCNADCTFDDSACTYCGDGVIGGDELCDGDSNGAACSDAGYLGGGTIACASDCTFDTSMCNGPICGVQDDGVGMCPAECSSCAGGVCIFDCPGNIIDGGPCNGLDLVCPAGWPCSLMCGDAGCVDTTFTCSDGVCTVDCDGIDACDGTTVTCGIQSCTATCDIFTEPDLDCADSCDCVPC